MNKLKTTEDDNKIRNCDDINKFICKSLQYLSYSQIGIIYKIIKGMVQYNSTHKKVL